jgi:hypothetical protein
VGETQAPERSGGERGGGKHPLLQKPYKTKGESMLKEDPTLLSVTSSAHRGQAGNASFRINRMRQFFVRCQDLGFRNMKILAITDSGFISLDILGYHPVAFPNIGK